MKYTSVVTLLIISTCECYKILCLLPYPGKSHYMVFEPLIEELAERGHQLTVVSFFPSHRRHPNKRDVSLTGLAPLNVEVVDLSQIDYQFYGLERFTTQLSFNMKLAENNLELCEKLINSQVFEEFVDGRGDYDVILYEAFNSDCMLGIIHNYGVPFVGLSSCGVLPGVPARLGAPENPSYVPSLLLPFTDNMNFFERLQNTLHSFYINWWFKVNIRREEQRVLEKRYRRKLPPLDEVAGNMSALLINTHYTLNGVRVMPPSFVEVGGLHLHNKTVQPLPEHLEKWLSDAKHGFILISFGSLIRGSTLPQKQLHAILKVIGGLKQKALWKWETEHIKNLPPNAMVSKWLPQYDLLNHPKCVAFITHGGLLSSTEAVSAGVPTVVVAVLGDQFGNAAHTHRATTAPYMTLAELNEQRFERALDIVLHPKTRAKAKQASRLWHSRVVSPMDTAVFYVEQTARFQGLHMSSNARNINHLQLYLVDVIAFIAIPVGAILGTLLWICKKIKIIDTKEKMS